MHCPSYSLQLQPQLPQAQAQPGVQGHGQLLLGACVLLHVLQNDGQGTPMPRSCISGTAVAMAMVPEHLRHQFSALQPLPCVQEQASPLNWCPRGPSLAASHHRLRCRYCAVSLDLQMPPVSTLSAHV